MTYKQKGRPTEHTVSVLDIRKNAIVFTGSVSEFVEQNFHYTDSEGKKNAKSAMYSSMNKGTTAFGGKVRVFKNLECF